MFLLCYTFLPKVGITQNEIAHRVEYDVTETIEYKIPTTVDVSKLSPLLLNKIRKRVTVKSVIQEIDDNGNLKVKMRIHSTSNLDEPWMNPIKEFYVDELGFHSITKKDYIAPTWSMSIPIKKDGAEADFRSHSETSSQSHQYLKHEIEKGSMFISFSENLGEIYQSLGKPVNYITATDFISSNIDNTKSTYYSPSKLLMITKTQVDNGTAVFKHQYVTNEFGQKVPLEITETTPTSPLNGPCLQLIKTRSYSNYKVFRNGIPRGGSIGLASSEQTGGKKSHELKRVKTPIITVPIIYPNPAKDFVSIVLPTHYNEPELFIFSLNGKKMELPILKRTKNKIHFSTKSLSPGVYLLHLNDNKNSEVFKLLIQ